MCRWKGIGAGMGHDVIPANPAVDGAINRREFGGRIGVGIIASGLLGQSVKRGFIDIHAQTD